MGNACIHGVDVSVEMYQSYICIPLDTPTSIPMMPHLPLSNRVHDTEYLLDHECYNVLQIHVVQSQCHVQIHTSSSIKFVKGPEVNKLLEMQSMYQFIFFN